MKELFKSASAENLAKFIFQQSPSNVPDLTKSPKWVIEPLKKEVAGELGNLMDDITDGVSKEESKKIFAEIDIKTEWNNGAPQNSGRYVLALQGALHALGYGKEVGTIDAMFGGKTKAGIRAFQKAWNEKNPNETPLKVDGQPGKNTMPKLLAALDGNWATTTSPGKTPAEIVAEQAAVAKTAAETAITNLSTYVIIYAINVKQAKTDLAAAKTLADESDNLNPTAKVDRTAITDLETKIANYEANITPTKKEEMIDAVELTEEERKEEQNKITKLEEENVKLEKEKSALELKKYTLETEKKILEEF